MGKRPFRKTSAPGGPWYEYYGTVCPICQNDGMCMIHEDGNRVVCCRMESKIEWAKKSSLPGWLHFLEEGKAFEKIEIDAEPDNPKNPDSELDRVFQALISELNMKKEHLLQLTGPARQLTIQQVLLRKYRSFPEKPWEAAKGVIERIGKAEDLIGTPGFHLREGKYGDYMSIMGIKDSILIPFRNIRNQIVGFQYRVDEVKNKAVTKQLHEEFTAYITQQPNHVMVKLGDKVIFDDEMEIKKDWKAFTHEGKNVGFVKIKKGNRYMWLSSASAEGGTGAGPLPVHISVPSDQLKNWKTGTVLKKKTVWVTEGPLKADIASDRFGLMYKKDELNEYGDTVLSVPGVNSWRIILPILEEMGVERVVLAIDMDAMTNPDVKMHLMECAAELKNHNYTIDFAMWDVNVAKGLDDLLLQNLLPDIKRLYTRQEVQKSEKENLA